MWYNRSRLKQQKTTSRKGNKNEKQIIIIYE